MPAAAAGAARVGLASLVATLGLACALPLRSVGPQVKVHFEIRAPSARFVQVVGSWEGSAWGGLADEKARLDRTRGALSDADRDGTWEATLALPPGRHRYRFIVDGVTWLLDPANSDVVSWAGGTASLLVVRSDGGSIDPPQTVP